MLTNQVLQKAINDMRGITGAEVYIWNLEGKCLVSTDEVTRGHEKALEDFLFMGAEEAEGCITGEYSIFMVMQDDDPVYLLMFVELEHDSDVVGALCVSQLENLLEAYREKLDKNSFFKNLLLKNILDSDISAKAKRVHVDRMSKRVVFVIEPKKEEDSIVKETLKSLYMTGIRDFVVDIDDEHVVFIKELSSTDTEKDIHQIAKTIADTLSAETMIYVRVAYGTVASDLRLVYKSYNEARIALDVGRSFYSEKTVLAYNKLGIGRLIHQLPVTLCKEFLDEVLEGQGLSEFDEETMTAAYYFFENNLNISETARQLYVHRNTLMYRLEKIQKKTGLDVRVFEDAMTFKVAILVSNHIHTMHSNRDAER